jgi:hypothetical protein
MTRRILIAALAAGLLQLLALPSLAAAATAVSVTGTEGGTSTLYWSTHEACADSPDICGQVTPSATIDWGDGSATDSNGTATVGCVANTHGSTCYYTVTGSHAYTEEGTYTVTLNFDDGNGGGAAPYTGTATIDDAPLQAGPTLHPSQQTGIHVNNVVAFVNDTNYTTRDPANAFSATIDWGDGATTPGTVVARASGGYAVRGEHVYVSSGSYPVAVTVSEEGGALVTVNGTMFVAAETANSSTFLRFDDLAAGTDGTTIYSDTVRFSGGATVEDDPNATSAPNVLAFKAGGEFEAPILDGAFTALHTSVGVNVGFGKSGTISSSGTAVLRAYDSSHNLLGEAANTIDQSLGTFLYVTAGGPKIAYFEVTEEPTDYTTQLAIDDLVVGNPEVPPPPDFNLSAPTWLQAIEQGGSTSATINIDRFDGSSGPIQFDLSGLPTGVTASFSPNPATGGTTTLTLTAAPDAPATSYYGQTLDITATPQVASVGASARHAQIGVAVHVPFTVAAGGKAGETANYELQPCTSLQVPVHVDRFADLSRSGYPFPGDVSLTMSGVPSAVTADLSPSTLTNFGSDATLTLSPGDYTVADSGTITITATSGGVTQTAAVSLRATEGSIDSVSPRSGDAPQQLRPGTLVTIHGGGFCPGSAVRFGAAFALPSSASDKSLTVNVPRLATTGTLSVVSPEGNMINAPNPFTVRAGRNTLGFRFGNPKGSSYSFDDVTAAFGYDQTHISINPCWPWYTCNIPTPIPNPFVGLFVAAADGALAGKGLCFGEVLTSQRLSHGDLNFSDFPPAGASTPFALDGSIRSDQSGDPSGGIGYRIHVLHLQQLSSEYLSFWVKHAALNAINNGNDIYSAVTNAIRQTGSALVALDSHGNGHAVLAYDVERDPNNAGTFYIYVYNPNVPYDPAGEEGSTLTNHQEAERLSTITVNADGGWSDPEEKWTGGGIGSPIVIAPYRMPPVHPTLPTSLDGLSKLLTALGSRTVTQVSDSSGHTLLDSNGKQNSDPNTALRDSAVLPSLSGAAQRSGHVFVSGQSGPLTLTLGGGSGGAVAVSPGFSAELTGGSGAGSMTVDSHAQSVDVSSTDGGPVGLKVVGHTADSEIGASASVGGGGGDKLQLQGGGLTVEHRGGAGKLALSLTSFGAHAVPGSLATSLMLAPGDVVRLSPVSWQDLSSSPVTVTVRSRNGHVWTLRLHGSGGLRLTLSARRAGHGRLQLTVHGPLARGAMIGWDVVRGGHLIAHHVITLDRPSRATSWTWSGADRGQYRLIARAITIGPRPTTSTATLRFAG